MNVTRNVVNDLLPLYQAKEASEDSRALVEEFLRENPEFQREILERAARAESLLAQPLPTLDPSLEMATLKRTRRFIRARIVFLSLSIACGLVPFSFAVDSHGLRWILWRDYPNLAMNFIIWSLIFAGLHSFLGWQRRRGETRR